MASWTIRGQKPFSATAFRRITDMSGNSMSKRAHGTGTITPYKDGFN